MKSKVAFYGVFIALALIIGYLETWIPVPYGIPGMKLGLTNIVIIVVIFTMGEKEGFLLSAVRIILSGMLFGSIYSVVYSFAGAILSFVFMVILKRTKKFSIISVSAVGGIVHNMGQLVVAIFLVENVRLIYYVPMLITGGLVTGILIGTVAREIEKRIKKLAVLQF